MQGGLEVYMDLTGFRVTVNSEKIKGGKSHGHS